MAKCTASRDWTIVNNVKSIQKDYLSAEEGETILNIKVKENFTICQRIANDLAKIKHSALTSNGDKWDCYQLRNDLYKKLDELISEIPSIIQLIIDSDDLIALHKHKFFYVFAEGIVHNLSKLLVLVGRLSNLNEKIYIEEQQNPLISEESITIHCIIAIWNVALEIMNYIPKIGQVVYGKENLKLTEFRWIMSSEFWVSGKFYAKAFLLDLVYTSWLQYKRHVKFDDYFLSLPFLCQCSVKTFFVTYNIASENLNDTQTLADILFLPLTPLEDCDFSMLTHGIKQMGIIPIEPFYTQIQPELLAHFLIWHLYSLAQVLDDNDSKLSHIHNCSDIIGESFTTAMEIFIPAPSSNSSSEFRLSPHQTELFKLTYAMLDAWCEKIKTRNNIPLIIRMLAFFDENWNLFGEKYFDSNQFRVQKLTMFQLFTKLVYDVIPLQNLGLGPATETLSDDQKKLKEVWDKLLNRIPSKPITAAPIEEPVTNKS